MVLRFAERQKALRSLPLRQYTTSLSSAQLRNGGETYSISFAPGMTVVSGGNGAGKSTTLGAIRQCLTGNTEANFASVRLPHWLTAIELYGTHDSSVWMASYDVISSECGGHCPAAVEYIDASSETEHILTLVRRDENRSDLVEGIDPHKFDTEQIEWLSYVLRRDYEEVNVFEVTAFSDDDDPVPFF